jgi:CHAD domain-containing protein
MRIKAKQLRYAAEAAAPVIGAPARRTAAAAEELQRVLGEHHDAVAAESWLTQAALRATESAGYAAGRFGAEQRRRQVDLRREWRQAWRDVRAKRARRWLAR